VPHSTWFLSFVYSQLTLRPAHRGFLEMSSSSSLPRIVKLSIHAQTPTRGSPTAAGPDLYSASSTTVPARGKGLIFTDLQIQFSDGCYGRIAPRSGLALNHHIHVGGGVFDRDYQGNVGVLI
jgi:dUTP pyrophosphatase